MRHNTFVNPSCEVNTSYWVQVNQGAGTTTGTVMSSDGLGGVFTTYYRQTWTAVTTGTITSTGIIIGSPTANGMTVTGGQPFVISGHARSNHSGRTAALVATFYDATNTQVGGVLSSATVDVSTGWERLAIIGTAPAGATHAYVRLYAQGGTVWAVNDTFDLGGVLCEDGATALLDYFDGSTLNCVWDGTAGSSTSTWLSLSSSRLRVNHCLNPVAKTATTGYAGSAGTGGTAAVTAGVAVTGCPDAATAARITWSVAPTGSTQGLYYYASTTHAGSVGGAWRASAWGRFSFACTAHCALYAYNSAGTNIGTHIMPSVAVAAGQWYRWVTDDYVPPAATDRLLMLIYRDSGGNAGVGDYMDMTACVIEPSVPIAGQSVSGGGVGAVVDPGFFDGDSLNTIWTGTAHASVSVGLAVGTNPAFPDLEVTAWPGSNPALNGVPSTQGRFLTDRAGGFRISRGRQYELAQDEAASGSLRLNNFDGAVTAGQYGCTPITSCHLKATWNGVTYSVWAGQIRSWPQQDDNPAVAWSEAELTDSFEALANHPFQSLVAEEIRSQTSPDAWYPMNEAASSTSIGNLVPGGPAAPLVSFKGGSVPFALGGTSVFAGTAESVLTLANSTGATGKASQYQMVGPQNPNSGYSMPFGAPWGVGIFVRMTAGASVVWSALDTDGSIMVALLVDAGTPQIVPYFRQGGRGATYFAAPVSTSLMKTGCYVHIGHDGTNAFCYVYGVNSDGSLTAVANYGACTITSGVSTWVAWGQSFRSDGIYYSSNADMQLCHGTIWTTSPPAPYTNPIIAIATAGLNAIYSYKVRDVVSFLASFAGVTAITGDSMDGAVLGQIRDTNKSAALDAIRQATLDYLGRVFMDKNGYLQWQSVHHGMGAATTWTIGSNDGAGEMPYTGAPKFDYDPTYVYNDVQLQRPDNRGVAQQVSSTKAMVRVTDTASQQEYFTRVLQVDSNVRYDADALAVAQYLLNRYKQPKVRVRTVTFVPSSNPELWPFILHAELGDTVTLNHRAIGRANISITLAIQKISHEIDAQAGTWVTTMEMTPWSSDWALAAMHTTVAAGVAAGVTSITLNPLPDSATNPSESSLAVGTTIQLSPGTANAETMTIASVVSTPTAKTAGYTGITVTFTAATAYPHSAGDVACDPLPSGVTDPTTWDLFSVLDSTTVVSI